MGKKDTRFKHLPDCAADYIKTLVKRVRYSRRVRADVTQELIDHFTDELGDCADAQARTQRAEKLIEEFGDVKLLAKLIRRGKKRCRPLWKKAIVRSFQGVGLLISLYLLYTVWFFMGSATISVDYLAKLNELSRPNVAETENAWPHYKRAIDLYVDPPEEIEDVALFQGEGPCRKSFEALSSSEQGLIKKWVQANEAAWNQLIAGSQKPHFWIEHSIADKSPLIQLYLPSYNSLRSTGKVGIWRSRIAMTEGRSKDFMEDCLAIARTGRHFQISKGFLIDQLVGITISWLAHEEIFRLVLSSEVSADGLGDMQEQLHALYADGYPSVDLEAERLTILDTVQHCFTEGGPGGGHLMPKQFQEHSFEKVGDPIALSLCGILFAGRDETVATINEFYPRLSEIVKLTPYEKRNRKLDGWSRRYIHSLGSIRFVFLYSYFPSLYRADEIAYRAKALHEATISVLAVRRWQLEKGEYPESLEQLIAGGYLKTLPADPYSDGPLKYAKRGEDFVLYSIGADFEDNGGVHEPNRSWGEDGGDHVFWPHSSWGEDGWRYIPARL